MLDQSFSAENFRKILDLENRKGVYLEGKYFHDIVPITNRIKQCSSDLREIKRSTNATEADIESLTGLLADLKESKEEKLMEALQGISQNILDSGFRILLTKISIPNEKPLYTPDTSPEHYFAIKQLQHNVSRLFQVMPANRISIVSQVKALFDNNFPKYVVRTDIKDFYESIPHEPILKRLNDDSLLSPFSKKLLRQILEDYKRKAETVRGIPRGIGVSAYIAELFMKNIDEDIKALKDVTYYARYVDDIVVIFTPTTLHKPPNYLMAVRDIVENKHSMSLNDNKTHSFDLTGMGSSLRFDYLGYRIVYDNQSLKILLSVNRTNKYRDRIRLSFCEYIKNAKANEKKARKLLVKRVRYLTGNTKLFNNKKHVLVGIYYSNSHLTDVKYLSALDRNLLYMINTCITSPSLQRRLQRFSFCNGFTTKRYSPFTAQELSNITSLWK